MPTTIQISELTLQLLRRLKEETMSKNYDEVIQRFLKKKKSMFGAHPEMTSFTEEDEARLHEI